MRIFKGIKWVLASALVVTSTQADVIIDSQTIPGSDIQSISISPTTGNIFITTIPGYDVTKSGTPPPSTVAITGFTASPGSITEGQSTTLSWTTSNAVSCTPTGGTGGWSSTSIAVPNGSKAITISTAGTYQFTLTCNGSNSDTDIKNATVIVSTQPQTGNCPAAPLSSGSVQDWSAFWGVAFPQPGYQNVYATIPRYGYLSLQFNTGNIVDDGKLSTIETTQTDGVRLGAISECPGDFNVAPECDYIWGISGGIRWATNGRSGACQLKANTTYYFNVTYTDGVNANTTTCSSAPCVTTIQAVNQ